MQSKIGVLWLIALGGLAVGMTSPMGEWIGKARITLRVINEDGEPVPSASVRGYFENPRERDYVGDVFDKRTDRNGEVAVSGKVFGYMEGRVLCDDHYRTRFRFDSPHKPGTLDRTTAWPNWVTTNVVVLKRIRNPTPMFVKTVVVKVPEERTTMAYDLTADDWIEPDGNGVVTDIVFQVTSHYRSQNDWNISQCVHFPGQWNGIVATHVTVDASGNAASALKSLHSAPNDRYSSNWTYETIKTPRKYVNPIGTNQGSVFYYRIRSVVDDQGRLISALYGKIYGHIYVGLDDYRPNRKRNLMIQFTYYLNPDGTRNVEFDPQRNLFSTAPRSGLFDP
jgi:hypothetical protein